MTYYILPIWENHNKDLFNFVIFNLNVKKKIFVVKNFQFLIVGFRHQDPSSVHFF